MRELLPAWWRLAPGPYRGVGVVAALGDVSVRCGHRQDTPPGWTGGWGWP